MIPSMVDRLMPPQIRALVVEFMSLAPVTDARRQQLRKVAPLLFRHAMTWMAAGLACLILTLTGIRVFGALGVVALMVGFTLAMTHVWADTE